MSQNQVIRRTSKSNTGAITLVIPTKFREPCALTEPTDIVITKHGSGLFIRKLRTDNDE
jgi:hypothetical protein